MEGPGRPSAASLAVAPVAAWARLEPPGTLTEAQVVIWRESVATKPSEWFKADCAPILEAYCKSITHYRDMVRLLDSRPEELKEHLKLAEAMCYDGTPSWEQREWAEKNGWMVREFRVTQESARELLTRGIPFSVATVEAVGAHMMAMAGFDRTRNTVLLRDHEPGRQSKSLLLI